MRCICHLLILSFLWGTSAMQAQCPPRPDAWHSLQVAAFPVESSSKAILLSARLKNRGYLTYYYRATLNGQTWIRVGVGCFAERAKAEELQATLQQREGVQAFVTTVPLFVQRHQDVFEIVTTPSGIWYQTPFAHQELYVLENQPANRLDLLDATQAMIAPSGKSIVFYYDHAIVTVEIATGHRRTVKTGVWNAAPQWSPDGQYIAYLDEREWEVPTSLWLLNPETGKERCLVKHGPGSQQAVKSFHWHPHRNTIFLVEGPAYGTVSVGGHLDQLDLSGERTTVVNKPETEVCAEFQVVGIELRYHLAHFKNAEVTRVTAHTLRLNDE